jgi:hypothetical protein
MNDTLPTGFRDRLLTELRALPSDEAAPGPTGPSRHRPLLLSTAAATVLAATAGTLLLAPQLHRPQLPQAAVPTGPAATTDAPVPAVFTVDSKGNIVWLTIADIRSLADEANRGRLEAALRKAGVPVAVQSVDGSCVWQGSSPERPGDDQALQFNRSPGASRLIRIDRSKLRPGQWILMQYWGFGKDTFALRVGVITGEPVCAPGTPFPHLSAPWSAR